MDHFATSCKIGTEHREFRFTEAVRQ